MLLAFLISYQIVVTFANPFHKYPFVFLLDVGNEELEKTNTEQFRVSMPGNSIALRYPAIGDGDTIGHIRVSGIDLGTDLKANIVDGGPGSKYVVLALMGNPGVAYEAVVTVQTIPNTKSVYDNSQDDSIYAVNQKNSDPYATEQDSNDSAEDTSDSESQYVQKMNAELTQSSSNIYSYAVNEVDTRDSGDKTDDTSENEVEKDDNNDDEEEENDVKASDETNTSIAEEKDIHKPAPEQNAYGNEEVEDYVDENTENAQEDNESERDGYNEEPVKVDRNLYKMYEALRAHLPDAKVVPIDAYDEQSDETYQEDTVEIDQMFNDEEVHSDGKYWDYVNNNNFDSDDSSAVAY